LHTKFGGPKYPEIDSEFEALMLAIDKALADKGLKPFQRPLHVARLLWEAFGWEGNVIPPKELAFQPGFEGDVIMAKAHHWYKQTYGELLKADYAYGYVPVKIRNAVWPVRFGGIHGTVRFFIDKNLNNKGISVGSRGVEATYNILCAVEGLPQSLADKINDEELSEFSKFYKFALDNLIWRVELPNIELLKTARADFDASTQDVLAHRYSQARWGAQQAVEKTLKGILTIAGTAFPTRGPNGHNLEHLGTLLHDNYGIHIISETLILASCSPKARYGDELSNQEQAINANHAVLAVFDQLRKNDNTEAILRRPR
jgi:HEPN domain-containing protein